MPKKSSIITVAAQGGGYSVDARGAFGGGWTRHVTLAELPSAIAIAWQQYGSNPLGCAIVGDLPDDATALAETLQSAGDSKHVLTIRVSEAEADMIRAAAEGTGTTMNQWCRNRLTKAASQLATENIKEVEMSKLYDRWAGSETPEELQLLSYEELLEQVTNLYNSGEEWQQDGAPADVTRQLWNEIHSES